MQVKVDDGRVYQNILIFLQLMSLLKEEARKEQVHSKTYTAFIHRNSGQIFFLEQLPDAEALNRKEWKVIELCCTLDPQDQHLIFELQEKGHEPQFFVYEDLAPLAYRVMSETVKALNGIGQLFKKTKDMLGSLEKLDQVKIRASVNVDLIRATWHDSDRWMAEEILKKQPYGSYFFRQDEYAKLLSEELQAQLHREIACCTLTFSEPYYKVSDVTLVRDGPFWLIYNDDPNLSGKRYESVDLILDELKERCKIPVFH